MKLLGIDFGTTNSCISHYNTNGINVIINKNGNYTTPTCLYFCPTTSDVLIGESARQQKKNVIVNFKRLIGLKYTEYLKYGDLFDFFNSKGLNIVKDPDTDYCAINVFYNGTNIHMSIPFLIQTFLKQLLADALEFLSEKIENIIAVVTVPAYFNHTQRTIIKNCYENIGVTLARIINEPTAAAICYNPTSNFKDEYVLVIDCGGGTTDVSLVSIDYQEQIYEVINTNGNNFLGGEDITQVLVDYYQYKLPYKNVKLHQIRNECERLKCELSYTSSTTFYYDHGESTFSSTLSRTQFINMCNKFFEQLEKLIQKTILGYTVSNVVFVGGTTRIPYFQTICKKILGNNILINNSLNPDTTISIGACQQGVNTNELTNNTECTLTLIDILPYTLGVEVDGGFMIPIVTKNTQLPVTKTRIFTNSEDYISSMDVQIFQGERKFVSDNHHLGTITLDKLDKTLKRGDMKINVKFDIDLNGLIEVSVIDDKTKSHKILCLNTYDKTVEIDTESQTSEVDSEDEIFQDSMRIQIVLKKLEIEKLLKLAKDTLYEQQSRFKFVNDITYKKLNILIVLVGFFTNYITDKQTQNGYLYKQVTEFYENFKNEWHHLMVNLATEQN